jgi:hypothetical protein
MFNQILLINPVSTRRRGGSALQVKVAGSLPDGVTQICYWQSFRSHYGSGVTWDPNRNEYKKCFLESKGGEWVKLTNLPPSCVDCLLKYGSLNLLELSGPVIGGIGFALPLLNEDKTSPWNTQIAICLWTQSLHLADQNTCIRYICRNIVQSLIYLIDKKTPCRFTHIQWVRYFFL